MSFTAKGFEVKGGAEILAKLKNACEEIKENAEKGINDAAHVVEEESMDEAPHDVGILMLSERTEKPEQFVRTFSYNTPYAARLHEHPEYKFQKGKKGKYLEDPLKRISAKLLEIIQHYAKV